MTATYCEDADITRKDPTAGEIMTALGEMTFLRVRELVAEDIARRLLRRVPSISVEDLADTTELKHIAVLGCLSELYRVAASRPGEEDVYGDTAKKREEEYLSELRDTPLTLSSGDTATYVTCAVLRG
jgi:hypothetical protein